jgi:FkbM family methyltransferase
MNFLKRLSFIRLHIQKIGLINTCKYFTKRVFVKENTLLRIKIKDWQYPIYLRNKTSDINIFYQIFIAEELNFYKSSRPSLNRIIDLGANIGLSSIFFLSRFNSVEVVCIEPEDSNFDILNKNLGFLNNVKLLKNGIHSNRATLFIIDPGKGKDAYYLSEIDSDDKINSIDCITINDIMELMNWIAVDLIKMDIEGAEKDVILNTQIKSWSQITKILALEIHDFKVRNTHEEIINKLSTEFQNKSNSGEYTLFYNLR